MTMPYTPIINIAHILESTLYLVEHTDYPHKGHPRLEHVKHSLRQAIDAIRELEPLQAEAARGMPVSCAPAIDAARNRKP